MIPFLLYLTLLTLSAIAARIHGIPWLVALWSACFWYGMLYWNGRAAEWAMNKAGETN